MIDGSTWCPPKIDRVRGVRDGRSAFIKKAPGTGKRISPAVRPGACYHTSGESLFHPPNGSQSPLLARRLSVHRSAVMTTLGLAGEAVATATDCTLVDQHFIEDQVVKLPKN